MTALIRYLISTESFSAILITPNCITISKDINKEVRSLFVSWKCYKKKRSERKKNITIPFFSCRP